MCTLTMVKGDYNITTINNKGVIFENMGDTRFFSDTWNFIARLKYVNTDDSLVMLNNSKTDLYKICNKYNNSRLISNGCGKFKDDINFHFKELFKTNEDIKHQFNVRRKKRSPLYVVGSAFKYVFGTMDYEDFIDINEKLNMLQQDDNSTFLLIQKQISLMNSSFHTLGNPIKNLENETKLIEEQINFMSNLLDKDFTQVQKEQNEQLVSQKILEITTLILFKLTEIKLEQYNIQNVILALRNNKLHPSIVNFREIQETLGNNTDIDKNLLEMHHLEQLFNIDFMAGNSEILIRIAVTIPQNSKYTLEKIYLLPVKVNNTYGLINLQTNYLAIREDYTQYIELRDHNYDKCKTININFKKNLRICELQSPVRDSKEADCILNLYRNIFAKNYNCEIRETKIMTDNLIKMESSNTWLFSFSSAQRFLFECDSQSSLENIKNQGIIYFTSNCKVSTTNFILPVAKNFYKNYRIYQPLTEPSTYIRLQENITIDGLEFLKPIKVNTLDSNGEFLKQATEFDKFQVQINITEQQRLNSLHNNKIRRNTIVGASSMSTFSLVLLVGVVWLIYKKCGPGSSGAGKNKTSTNINIVNSTPPPPPTTQSTCLSLPTMTAPTLPKRNRKVRKDDDYLVPTEAFLM